MNQAELDRLRNFQLTLAHSSDLYEIIQQRAESLDNEKFHWFVRLESLLFITEQVVQNEKTNLENEFIAQKLKNSIVFLINENKPNYAKPLTELILYFLRNAPAPVYDVQSLFLLYLQELEIQEFCNIFTYFPVDGATLAEIIERAQPEEKHVILSNVAGFCEANEFHGNLETGIQCQDIANLFPKPESQNVEFEEDNSGQTLLLLKQAEQLVSSDQAQTHSYEINESASFNENMQQENAMLRQKLTEYEETLRALQSDAPIEQLQTVQMENAQIRQAFDQLMIKYQSQKKYVAELKERANQYQEKIAQFKILFDEANERYEEMKAVANERIGELKQGTVDNGELKVARAEIEKLKSEKAELSDITKKLITKLNSK